MKKIIVSLFILLPSFLSAREDQLPANAYASYFKEAYAAYPDIPQGVLEAVAFTNTHFYQLTESGEGSCMGMPRALTVMGMMEDGKGWFRNNLITVSEKSGYTVSEIKNDPRTSILAYAKAFNSCIAPGAGRIHEDVLTETALRALNEFPLPLETDDATIKAQKEFVQQTFLYGIYSFLSNPDYAAAYHFRKWNIDLSSVFGENNYAVLSAEHIMLSRESISNGQGDVFRQDNSSVGVQSPDYGPALWNPAASCNYTTGRTQAITAVTIHDVEGSYAGCISWFQNCAAQVSAHYVVRSSDGQITQMVLEANKAWHVGTENPYTVGIEHEGYQSQTGWYTNAMYTQSAALVRDICSSNNIDPLRTGWWPWLHTTYYNVSGIPGACTKVKGHMHFPNQTHDDPGPNWDWEYFYELVNNNPPAATMLTTASGNFYDSGGAAANYSDDERSIWTIAPANATSVTVNFNSFSAENTWDYLFIYDGADITAPLIGYYTGTSSPGTITSSGGSLTFEFRSDCATNAAGWNATWTSTQNVSADNVAPVTSVAINGTWQTQDFTATFSEADNAGGSGLEKSFFQVIDYDGSDWRANNTQGFFSDNFDLAAINSEWTAQTGTWALNNGALDQSDENLSNTNIFAPLTQNLSNKYLYNWAGKINGTGNNRRAGFHFFCDSPTLTNRGNNYFVWFRVDQGVCEFYKVVNDVFTLENSVPMTTNANQWYDWKIIYDRVTGKIEVYQDNAYIGSWTDPSPIANGNYVSFRSGNCDWQVDNFKVYRSRLSNSPCTITVGNCASCELRYQNTNPSTPAGRIKSIVRDSANNLSAVAYQDVNIDWTAPLAIAFINDGPAADTDLSISPTDLAANWATTTDPNSGLARYYYALGTTSGDSDVVNWTSNWGYDTVALTGLPLVSGQWYYFGVRAENGAGLVTQHFISDGILVDLTTGIVVDQNNGFTAMAYPSPFSSSVNVQYVLPENAEVRIELHDMSGRVLKSVDETQTAGNHKIEFDTDGLQLAPGVYLVTLSCNEHHVALRLIKK